MNVNMLSTFFSIIKKLFLCFFVLSTVFASNIDEAKFIGYLPTLVIQPTKESPAFAAMEDITLEMNNADENTTVTNSIQLKAKEDFDFSKYILTTQVEVNVKKLSGIVISQPKQRQEPNHASEEPQIIASSDINIFRKDGRLKPLSVRKKQLLKHYANIDFNTPTLYEKASELVDEQLKQAKKAKATHGNVYVAIPTDNNKMATESGNKPRNTSKNEEAKKPKKAKGKSLPTKYIIEGHIVLTGGVAFTGINDLIDIYVVRNSEVVDSGIVDLKSGKYYLETNSLTGTIVAELRSDKGQTHGLGDFSLYDIPEEKLYTPHFKNLNVAIKPYEEGVDIEVISAYSFENVKYNVDNSKVFIAGLDREIPKNEDDRFTDKSILNGSSYLARAYAPKHWGSLSIGITGVKETIRLFSKKMIDSLLNLVLGRYEAREAHSKGIIWGEVVANGMPLQGAKVEIAGQEEISPIYYNQFLPDRKLEETTSSGQFVFLNINPGTHALRVKYHGKVYPAELVAADSGHVSYVKLTIAKNKMFEVKTFDAFTGYGIPAIYSVFGYDKEYETNKLGNDLTYVPRGTGLVIFDIKGDDGYPLQRISGNRKSSSIEIPMVKQDWLQGLAVKKRINIDGDKGIIVGFVGDVDFEAFFDNSISKNLEIIYFDKNGDISESGHAGGGFIIYNAKTGPQTVSILPKDSTDILTHLVVTDTKSIFVTKF